MKYIVVGTDKNLLGRGGFFDDRFQYPIRGIVEDTDWVKNKGESKGIIGIDEISYKFSIGYDCYLIIEYDPVDGFERISGDYTIKIRKGKVVFFSKHIANIQKWIEKRGHHYRGHGANLEVKDDVTLKVGSDCIIKAGDGLNLNCGGYTDVTCGDYCIIDGEDYLSISCGDCVDVTVEGSCVIVSGKNSHLFGGPNSTFCAGNRSTMSAGEDSVLIWKEESYNYILHITESESCNVYRGEIVNGKFEIEIVDSFEEDDSTEW